MCNVKNLLKSIAGVVVEESSFIALIDLRYEET